MRPFRIALLAISFAALAPISSAAAATAVQTTAKGSPVCILNSSDQTEISHAITDGVTAAQLCDQYAVPTSAAPGASLATQSVAATNAAALAQADEEEACGDLDDKITPDDPSKGHFTEDIDFSISSDFGVILDAATEGIWINDTTGGGNEYGWTFGPAWDDDASRSPDSGSGIIDTYATVVSEVYWYSTGLSYACDASTDLYIFDEV